MPKTLALIHLMVSEKMGFTDGQLMEDGQTDDGRPLCCAVAQSSAKNEPFIEVRLVRNGEQSRALQVMKQDEL